MGAFFVYIVKSAVCLAVFYLFYRLLLSRETFHRFNRIALLGNTDIVLCHSLCGSDHERTDGSQPTIADLGRTATYG